MLRTGPARSSPDPSSPDPIEQFIWDCVSLLGGEVNSEIEAAAAEKRLASLPPEQLPAELAGSISPQPEGRQCLPTRLLAVVLPFGYCARSTINSFPLNTVR